MTDPQAWLTLCTEVVTVTIAAWMHDSKDALGEQGWLEMDWHYCS